MALDRRQLLGMSAGAFVIAVIGTGCGSADDPSAADLDASDRPDGLDEVRAVYGEDLRALGLRVGGRGGLLRRDGYENDPKGTHLAIYLIPTGPRDPDHYATGLLATAQLLIPDALDRWPGVQSIDVCQEDELTPGEPEDDAEAPVTLINLTRPVAESVSWADLTLSDLVKVADDRDEDGFIMHVDSGVRRQSDVYRSAAAAAGVTLSP